MITANTIDMMLGDTETYFVAAPYACHLEDVRAISQDTGMTGATVTVTNGVGGTDIGVATLSTNVAGELASYSASDANQEIAKDGIIQIVISDIGTNDKFHVTLVLDPYRLQPA